MYISQLDQDKIDAINSFLAEKNRHDLIFTPEKIEYLKNLTNPGGDPLGLVNHREIILCGRMYDLDNGHHGIPCTSNYMFGMFEVVIVTYDFEPKSLIKELLKDW